MTIRVRAFIAAVAVGVHLFALVPIVDNGSRVVERGFSVQAERILDGDLPYTDVDYEYPPLSLPLLLVPGELTSDGPSFGDAFAWEMLGFDIAIVLLIALGLRAGRDRVIEALAVYTLGILALSGSWFLPDSAIGDGGPLALARFDLAPAALVLAALIAREAAKSAAWSALLATATAVKAYPLLLLPALLRDETRWRRVAIAAAPPLLVAAAIVVLAGDEFGSAIAYHTERDLQVETIGATPLMLAHVAFGTSAGVEVGGGSFNLLASGADLARTLSIIAFAIGYLAVVIQAWRRRTPVFEAATAIVAVTVVFAPVLSPQFLLWLLPVSAAAYGLRWTNVVLLAAFVLTQHVLEQYIGVANLEPGFVWTLTARNALLLAYLALVLVPLFRGVPGDLPEEPTESEPARPTRVTTPA